VLYAEVMRFGPFRSPGRSTKPSGGPHDEKTLSCRQRIQTAPNATATTRAWRLVTARLKFGQTGARRFAAPTPILKYRRPEAAGLSHWGCRRGREERKWEPAREQFRYLERPGCREIETRCKSHGVDNMPGARANQRTDVRLTLPRPVPRRAELSCLGLLEAAKLRAGFAIPRSNPLPLAGQEQGSTVPPMWQVDPRGGKRSIIDNGQSQSASVGVNHTLPLLEITNGEMIWRYNEFTGDISYWC
jgi:hypothetical protein